MGLGPVDLVSLAEARELARDARRLLLEGRDPIEERRAQRQAAAVIAKPAVPTFKACAERYIASHEAGWRNRRHAAQWPATLAAYVYPVFGHLPVNEIDTDRIMRALEPIWATRPETASRVRGRIEFNLELGAGRRP